MSGGSFDYAFGRVNDFADALSVKLDMNDCEDGDGWKTGFSPETVAKLREIEVIARKTAALMMETEWLYSGDTGEESFAERVRHIEDSNKVEIEDKAKEQLKPLQLQVVMKYRTDDGEVFIIQVHSPL